MITCIINGHKAYPISTSSIKVTYANQYVTDDGEYTYDITFPHEYPGEPCHFQKCLTLGSQEEYRQIR